jgi:diacylglycerol kinase (ATP)
MVPPQPMIDVVLLHNRKAGNGVPTAGHLTKLLRSAGYRPVYHEVHDGLDDPKLFRRGEFVIAAGGDGTIRKVALALLGSKNPPLLAPLPLGTANNISHSLGVDASPETIVRGWAKGRRRKFDIGVARGPWGKRPFLEGLGIGLVSRAMAVLGTVDEASQHEFKTAEGKLHRDLCVFAALAHEVAPRRAILKRDGRPKDKDDFLLVEVLNIRRAGPGVELAPDADPFDGRLDLVALAAAERETLVGAMLRRVAGKGAGEVLRSKPVRRVQLKVRACEVRIDDQTYEVVKPAKIDVTVKPGALHLLLPAKQAK